jgi:hypothetical protein
VAVAGVEAAVLDANAAGIDASQLLLQKLVEDEVVKAERQNGCRFWLHDGRSSGGSVQGWARRMLVITSWLRVGKRGRC